MFKMTPEEFQEFLRTPDPECSHLTHPVILESGLELSIQRGYGWHSTRFPGKAEFYDVEVKASRRIASWAQYKSSVVSGAYIYAYVPVTKVIGLINRNGGVKQYGYD